jgi:hypothetical protein
LVGAPIKHQLSQEDIESWMPSYYWHMVNSTIGSFSQLAASNKDLIASEMIRMHIRKDVTIPHMDVCNKLLKFSKSLGRKKKNHDMFSQKK